MRPDVCERLKQTFALELLSQILGKNAQNPKTVIDILMVGLPFACSVCAGGLLMAHLPCLCACTCLCAFVHICSVCAF